MNIRPPAVAFVEDIVEFICGNLNATLFCLVFFIHLCVAGNADSRIGILMVYWDVITYVQLCIRTVFLLCILVDWVAHSGLHSKVVECLKE